MKKYRGKTLSAIAIVAVSGCTAVSVQPLANKPQHMCIERNEAVIIADFVPVLQAGLKRHGMTSTLHDVPPVSCSYVLSYTARRSWDMAPYLSTADLEIRNQQGRRVATAHYHLRGKGGLSLVKWASVKSKMDPVMDELLAGATALPQATPAVMPAAASMASKEQQLEALKATPMGYEQYQRRYREIMAQ